MVSKKCLLLFVIFGLFTALGCRGPKIKGLVPIQGTVTYKGEPLEGATVCFVPKELKVGDRLGTGMTDVKGRFVLRTIGELGVLPGEYVVVVIKNEILPLPPRVDPNTGRPLSMRPLMTEIKSLIPKRYSDPKTSDVSVTVGKNGLQDWHLEIVD